MCACRRRNRLAGAIRSVAHGLVDNGSLRHILPQNQEHVSLPSRQSFDAFGRSSMRLPPFEPGLADDGPTRGFFGDDGPELW